MRKLLLFVLALILLLNQQGNAQIKIVNKKVGPGIINQTPSPSMDTYYRDMDQDGYGNPNSTTGYPGGIAPAGYVSNNTDCDDTKASVNPGATEICGNRIDDNCNGQVDENPCTTPITYTYYADADGDGYGNPASPTTNTTGVTPTGYVSNNTDCDDANAAIKPTTVWYKDADNDAYSDGATLTQCAQPANYKLASALTATSGDCNDGDGSIHVPITYYVDHRHRLGHHHPGQPE